MGGLPHVSVKVPHTHPHSQFIPSRHPKLWNQRKCWGFSARWELKELPKGGDRGCVTKIPQEWRLFLSICLTPDPKGACDGFPYHFCLTPPTPPQSNRKQAFFNLLLFPLGHRAQGTRTGSPVAAKHTLPLSTNQVLGDFGQITLVAHHLWRFRALIMGIPPRKIHWHLFTILTSPGKEV